LFVNLPKSCWDPGIKHEWNKHVTSNTHDRRLTVVDCPRGHWCV